MVSRVICVFLIVCMVFLCVVTYLDFTGMIDVRGAMLTRLEQVPSIQQQVRAFKLGTLGQEAILEKQRAFEVSLREVEQRHEELDKRESVLGAREKELETFAEELNKVRNELDKSLQDLVLERERMASLQRLADMYSNMKSKEAAAVLQGLSPDFTATILAYMDDRAIANIVSAMSPSYAGEITRIFSTMDASQVLPGS